jgi:dTDP-4-dehydrorhamnose reductase
MAKFVEDIIIHFPLLSGLYNVSSHPISKFDLLNLFNNTFNCKVNIQKDQKYTSQKDLVSTKFYNATGFKCPIWEDLVTELYQDSQLNSIYYKN